MYHAQRGSICTGIKRRTDPFRRYHGNNFPSKDRPFQAAVITLSDKGARGERTDESGPAAKEMLEQAGYEVAETLILPDDPEMLKTQLIRLADARQLDLVVTSGGTGFSLRDQTPEATLAVADRIAPGIAEAIRCKSMEVTNRAMLAGAYR